MIDAAARRWWALAALAHSVLVVGLDLFVLNLALPTVAADLHASSGDLQWFVASYSLVLAAALLPAGLLGDRYGRKRLLIAGLVLFGLASAACAYAASAGQLIAARATLGLAAAVITPLSIAVIPVLFTPAERPKAIAIVGGATFLGFPIGPILGGWLLDHYWWGSVFLINVPVVVIALVTVCALLPESRAEQPPRLDAAGAALSSAGLATLTYGLIQAGQDGWSDPVAVAAMSAGAAILAAFVGYQVRLSRRPAGQPLVDLTLFRSAGFTWGTILSTMVQFALFGIIFAVPQYFLNVRGLDSLGGGIRLLPMIGGLIVGLGIGQRLQRPRAAPGRGRTAGPLVSANILAGGGFAVMAAALAIGAGTQVSSGTWFGAAWLALTGLGLGFAMPTALNAALGALSAERSGSGSALLTAVRQVGGTFGVAVLGTILAAAYRAQLHLAGLPYAAQSAARGGVAGGVQVATAAHSEALLDAVRGAFVHGMDIMLWTCAGIAAVAAALALAFLPRRAEVATEQAPGGSVAGVGRGLAAAE